MKRLLVVYNPKSGSASMLSEVKQAFASHDIEPEYIPINATKLSYTLAAAAKQRNNIIVAMGGDGTINSIVAQLHGKPCSLGIIPAGTLNHFAKTLCIPLDAKKAVRLIAQGTRRYVDIGTVNEHVFVNNSSIGMYPRSLRTRNEYDQLIGKWFAGMLGFIRAIIRPRHYRVRMTIDGQPHTFRTPFVFIGNNEYKRTQPDFGERTTMDSGKLAIYIVKATNLLEIVRMFAHALFTKKRRTQDFALHLADTCIIRTRHQRKIHIACDGEVLTTRTPLHYHSEHKNLRVIAPKISEKT